MEGRQCKFFVLLNCFPKLLIIVMIVKYDFSIPGKPPLYLSVLIPLAVVS